MTVPGIDMFRGSPDAYSRQVAGVSAEPALPAGHELASTQEWLLRSYLELRAVPVSVRSARLHAKNTLREWGMETLADTVELLVSEIVTNAVRASAEIANPQPETRRASRGPRVRLWLTSAGHGVLIQVWDGHHHEPVCQEAAPDEEAGRGLLLVETLSAEWGCYAADGPGGKIVWAVCTQ